MDNEQYISPFKLTKQFDVTSGTLRRWAEDGKIRCLRPNNGKRIYNVNDVTKHFGIQPVKPNPTYTICYARVSSLHQKEDLERQINLLKEQYPKAKIIKDIGSGLNWNRPGFRTLLEHLDSKTVSEVVVAYKDRLCRFGFELMEWIIKKANAKLVVLNANNDITDASRELSDDLLAITTVFVAKNNGLRAAHYRKQRKAKVVEKGSKENETSRKSDEEVRTGNT
jgi:predicted site-specific integrase-resolvase